MIDRRLSKCASGAGCDLSIIIVSWNTRDLLDRCLGALEHELAVHPLSSEVWIVDNGSSDGTAAMIRARHPSARLIENRDNVGFAAANNQAIAQANGRYVLLLNSDTEVVSGALHRLITLLDSRPQAGMVGPKLVNRDGSYQAGPARFPTLATTILESWGLIQLLERNPYYPSERPTSRGEPVDCDWVGGACLLVRRQAIDEVGLLDEGFFMNSEEVDWCYRMKQRGWQVWFAPDASVVHLGGASADRATATQRKRNYRGKMLFLSKHNGAAAGKLVRFNFRVSSLVKTVAYGARFVVSRRAECRQIARTHWQVAWEKW